MPIDITNFPIEIAEGDVENHNPLGETSFAEYWDVRRQLINCCRRFGLTGPEDGWHEGIIYWVVDGQYNDQLFQRVQVYKADALTLEWMTNVIELLASTRGWAASIGFSEGFLALFPHRIVASSPLFDGCTSLTQIVKIARRAIAAFDQSEGD